MPKLIFEFRTIGLCNKCCICNRKIQVKEKRLVERRSSITIYNYCLECAMKRIKRERIFIKSKEKVFSEVERTFLKVSKKKKYKIIDEG